MSRFWFSPKNIVRYTKNIKLLFTAVDSDLDEIDAAITDLNTRVSQMDGADESGRIKYMVYDSISDQEYDIITDETGDPILSGRQAVTLLERVIATTSSNTSGS